MKKSSGEELYHSIQFIDWALPKKDEEKLRKQLDKEGHTVGAYVMSLERLAIARRFRYNICEILEFRFGPLSSKIENEIVKIYHINTLHFLFRFALQCKSLNTFEQELPAAEKYPAGRIERVGTNDAKPATRRQRRN